MNEPNDNNKMKFKIPLWVKKIAPKLQTFFSHSMTTAIIGGLVATVGGTIIVLELYSKDTSPSKDKNIEHKLPEKSPPQETAKSSPEESTTTPKEFLLQIQNELNKITFVILNDDNKDSQCTHVSKALLDQEILLSLINILPIKDKNNFIKPSSSTGIVTNISYKQADIFTKHLNEFDTKRAYSIPTYEEISLARKLNILNNPTSTWEWTSSCYEAQQDCTVKTIVRGEQKEGMHVEYAKDFVSFRLIKKSKCD